MSTVDEAEPTLALEHDYESIMQAVEDDPENAWDDQIVLALAMSKRKGGQTWARFKGKLSEIDNVDYNSYQSFIAAEADGLDDSIVTPDAAPLDADEFADTLEIGEKDDRARARHAYEWIESNLDVRAIEEESTDAGLLYCTHDGLWTDGGERIVGRALNELMGSYSAPRLTNIVTDQYLKIEAATNISADELGLEPGLVAVENGILDLYAGEIVGKLEPADYAVTMVPHEYDPNAECPAWERFISESVENQKQDLIQEYVGYCLLQGDYPFAKALMLLGDGDNGKTTFLSTVETLLGATDNVMNADLSELAGGRFSSYRLEGKLANINADIEGDSISHTSMFKNMTGGDSFQVEQKYGDPYDLENSAKLIFAANKIPVVATDERAFFNRWLLVTFPHSFTLADDNHPDADPMLESKLENEMSGILTWAVEGFQQLVENDGVFTNQLSGQKVYEKWKVYADPVEQFIRDRTVYDPGPPPTPCREIYEEYTKFMRGMPSSPKAQRMLTSQIKAEYGEKAGYKTHRIDGDSTRGFANVHLRRK